MFSRLYVFYKEKVYAVATEADKKRVDDYAVNKNFKKSADYTYHKTSDFDKLSGNVESTIRK